MKTRVDSLFRSEAERFALRFTCESCVHYAPETRCCAHGYPNEAHREVALERVSELEFCKEFELA
ncbi:MAG TPA: hypothetical protein VGQ57_11930 [Polyangiaceae bacterium]|jgi:hypothetical protein|nr:hypothetical protein [Polyangiaceae bacterium]